MKFSSRSSSMSIASGSSLADARVRRLPDVADVDRALEPEHAAALPVRAVGAPGAVHAPHEAADGALALLSDADGDLLEEVDKELADDRVLRTRSMSYIYSVPNELIGWFFQSMLRFFRSPVIAANAVDGSSSSSSGSAFFGESKSPAVSRSGPEPGSTTRW
jgi:hypothetical protein